MRFIALKTEDEVIEFVKGLPNTFALDCETTGLNPRLAQLKTIVISPDGESGYSIPAEFLPLLDPINDPTKHIYGQNFKYDLHVLYEHGLNLLDVGFTDSMLLHHIIDETKEHGLDAMIKERFNDNYKEVFWGKFKTYEDADPQSALEYECKDAIYTYRLCTEFLSQLQSKLSLVDSTHRLAKALLLTEIRGVEIDEPLMLKTREEMGGRIEAYLPKLREDFLPYCQLWELNKWVEEINKRVKPQARANVKKPEFNFGSAAQVQWLLYDQLKLPVLKKTEAGKPSTDYETIEKLEQDHPVLKPYKDYIEIKTIYGTFVEGLISRVDGGRIYPSFNVNGTKTRRVSHSNPNMGNMPKDGPYRNFFLPDLNHKIIGSDFSQLEVVIEAHLTQDKNLKKIVLEGVSKHDITASEMRIPRDTAKTINFAMGYRCGVRKLQRILKCSYQEAEFQWNKYWDVYKGCRDLQLLTDTKVDAGIPVENMFGAVRHLPKRYNQEWERDAAKRQAYNFIIQSVGAELTHRAFYGLSERLEKTGRGRALWEVHDEVIASVKSEHCEEELTNLVSFMDTLGDKAGLSLPLRCKGYGPHEMWSKG